MPHETTASLDGLLEVRARYLARIIQLAGKRSACGTRMGLALRWCCCPAAWGT